jgi:molybdopterin-guanine dinucleotide biosynthesis protein B
MRVIGIAGWSGAGKTTLISRVIPYLREQGLRISVIKHAHHDFDVDIPGKDSWVHRQSGAEEVLVSSANRWVLMHELRGVEEPQLPALLQKMSPVDLVVIEGFRCIARPTASRSCFPVIQRLPALQRIRLWKPRFPWLTSTTFRRWPR